MKRISKKQLAKALRKVYGISKKKVAFDHPGSSSRKWVVTARFGDGATLVLKGPSLLGAARSNPRLADEFS